MSKIQSLLEMLTEWKTVDELLAATGWKPHTLRGALSVQAKKRGLTIERRRSDGVTSYRINPADYDSERDIRESVNVGLQTVKQRMANGGERWPKD